MQETEIRIEAQTRGEPEDGLELLAAIAVALREYQRRAAGISPQVWRPASKTEWRMTARW
jgi:hypothetical protein